MAANKFASKLHKNCPKILVILVYALLEWILILLLLLNSFLTYLIAKFAKFFGLKPSCTWCSRLPGSKTPHFDHVCEAHGTEISNLSFCSTHNKLGDFHSLCIRCSSSIPPRYGSITDVSSMVAFFTRMSEHASSQGAGKEARCSCCDDQILATKVSPYQSIIFKPTWDVLLEYVHKNKLEKQTQFEENGRDVDDEQQRKKAEIVEDSNVEVQEWNSRQTTSDDNEEDESVYIADMLLQNAESMDSDRFICIELIDTDGVAPTLTNSSEDVEERVEEDDTREIEAAAVEEYDEKEVGEIEWSNTREEAEQMNGSRMEALYAELEEEREAAAEAARETMAMITKLQEEKAAMQMEAVQYQRMMEEQAEYDQEALQLLNDLINKRDRENKQLQQELQMYRTTQQIKTSPASSNSTSHLDLDQEMEDVSFAEFDEERVSILEQVKVLEAKKLLPLFDGEEDEEMSNQSSEATMEDLGHVYERVQALEADSDFLKHCIRSMSKGNEGMALLKEILQHLRDLKHTDALPIKQDLSSP